MIQLVYMWIENFRTLKNINLNFHSNFEFEFEPKIDEVKDEYGNVRNVINEGTLKIKKFNPNDEFVYRYFPENQFISLIVGKNGTGKSSILDLLYEETQVSTEYRCILVFLEKVNTDEYKFNVLGAKAPDFDGNSILLIKEKDLREIKLELLTRGQSDITGENKRISNLSMRFITSEFNKVELISEQGQAFLSEGLSSYIRDLYKGLEETAEQFKNYISCGDKFRLATHRMNMDLWINFFKHITFLRKLSEIDKNIKIPDIVTISIRTFIPEWKKLVKGPESKSPEFSNFKDEKELIEELKNIHNTIADADYNKCLEEYFDKMFQWQIGFVKFLDNYYNNKDRYLELFKMLFKISLLLFNLFNFYKNAAKYMDNKEKEEFIKDICKRLSVKLEKDDLGQCLEAIFNSIKEVEINGGKLHFLKKLSEVINALDNMLKSANVHENATISVKIEENTVYKLEKFASAFKKSYSIPTIGNVILINTYPNLSSGQKWIINLVSKIESLVSISRYNPEAGNNVMLLLDEPEVYLHPEWQRLFIYILTSFIKEKFPEKYFHIIITTHSPFLLSDIPKENCIFLDLKYDEENQEYITKAKSKEEISNTLAQNIYYLLADGFFMEKGVGEYINMHLKQFLEKINKGALTSKEEKEFRELIGNIGDTVLRNKLFQILENKEFYKGKLKR